MNAWLAARNLVALLTGAGSTASARSSGLRPSSGGGPATTTLGKCLETAPVSRSKPTPVRRCALPADGWSIPPGSGLSS